MEDELTATMKDLLVRAKGITANNQGSAPTIFKAELAALHNARQMQLIAKQQNLIDELGRFANTVKVSGDDNAQLTEKMLAENEKLGNYTKSLATATLILAVATVLMAILTGWMAWSTHEMVQIERSKP